MSRFLRLTALILLTAGFVYLSFFTDFMSYFNAEAMRTAVTDAGMFAPLLFMTVYVVATILFIPGTPLTLLAGVLFGPWYGTLYVVVGATLGAVLAFLLARGLGRGAFSFGRGGVATRVAMYDAKLATHGLGTVLFLRSVPLFPFNGLNFALGLTSVKPRDYVVGTFFGIIPGTFSYVYFGDSLAMLKVTHLVMAVVLMAVVVTLGVLLKRRYG